MYIVMITGSPHRHGTAALQKLYVVYGWSVMLRRKSGAAGFIVQKRNLKVTGGKHF